MSGYEFWQAIYIAAIRAGDTSNTAGGKADEAIVKYSKLGREGSK